MAKTKKVNKNKAPHKENKLLNFLKDERLRLTIGIFIGILSLYLFLSILSFFFSGAADQSKLDMPFKAFMKADVLVRNWTGKFGAYLSNLIVNRGFGIASLLPILFLSICSLRLFGLKTLPLRKAFTWMLVGTIWFSLFFGFFFISGYEDTALFLGGVHGYFVSLWLSAAIGQIGTIAVLVLTLFLFFLFAIDNSIELLKKWRDALTAKISELKAERKKDIQAENKEDEEEAPIHLEEEKEKEFTFEEKPQAPASIEPAPQELKMDVEQTKEDTIPATAPATTQDEDKSEEELNLDIVEKEKEDQVKKSVKLKDLDDYDPTLSLSKYKLPTLDLLVDHKVEVDVSEEELYENKNRIVETLEHYGIKISNIKATIGPTVTLYEIVPDKGMRISKIKNLEDDIALSLAALGIRIIAPIPGKGTVGIEVPNKKPEMVSMYSVIASKKFQEAKYELPIALGKTITNETFCFDLAKMPHMLVAGATGQGKSVGINAIITSLLYKKHPSQLKFVFVDPKKVELSIYSKIEKHYLAKLPDEEDPIITDVQKVVATLKSLTIEMDERYDLLKVAAVRHIKEYNAKFIKRRLNPEKGHRYLPYIVVVVDEFADLIMTAGKDVEMPIARIAQLARAVGIHMILATQRPSANIVTGAIKANFPARVAFKVSSAIDSRTILDASGANQLIGRGDMLINTGGGGEMTRVQCAFVDTPEVDAIVNYIGDQKGYPSAHFLPEYVADDNGDIENSGNVLAQRDALFEEAAKIIVMNQSGSTSMLQRRMNVGYNRAGRLIDQMEAANIVGPFEGSKARKVLIADEMALEAHLRNLDLNAH